MPCRSGSTAQVDRGELRRPEQMALPIDSGARAVMRTAVAILLVLLALWVASDFLSALVWAAVIAITTWPIYIRFAPLVLGGRTLAPLLFTLLTGLVLLVPILLTVHQIAQGSDQLQSFGLIGLFLGPVIMAAVLAVWRGWIGMAD